MASFGYNAVQAVPLNQGAILNTFIGCKYGFVLHENESGIIILRGVVDNPYQRFARYRVSANANIAIPEGGTVVPIAVAFAQNGETRNISRAIVTPAAVGDYFFVSSEDFIEVPRGCCTFISFRNVAASEDATYVPAPTIDMQNLNMTIEKVRL